MVKFFFFFFFFLFFFGLFFKGEGLISCKKHGLNAAIVRLAFCACDVMKKVGMRGRSVQFCLDMSQAFSDFHWHELLRSKELKFVAKKKKKKKKGKKRGFYWIDRTTKRTCKWKYVHILCILGSTKFERFVLSY